LKLVPAHDENNS